jgi:hypothetical protein
VNIVASKTPAPPGTWLSMPNVCARKQALMNVRYANGEEGGRRTKRTVAVRYQSNADNPIWAAATIGDGFRAITLQAR